MRRSLIVLLLLFPTGQALATGADPELSAPEEEGYPLAVAARPLTLTKQSVMLSLYSDATFLRGVDQVLGFAGLGVAYGVLDRLTLDASLVPMGLTPTVSYGPPSVGGTWKFLDGRTEMGISLGGAIPVSIPSRSPPSLSFSGRLKVRHHLSRETTFRGGIGPWISRREVTTFGATANLGITQNFGQHFFVNIDSAVGMGTSSLSTLFYVPLTVIGGFSVEFGENLIFDSTVYASCPTVLASGRERPLAIDQGTVGFRFGLVFR